MITLAQATAIHVGRRTKQPVYRVVTRCILPRCACPHRDGILLYEGSDELRAAKNAKCQPTGFETTQEIVK